MTDPRSLLPWWHRRIVIVTDDEAWASATSEGLSALNGHPEIVPWSRAAQLEGPTGALLARIRPSEPAVREALARWAGRGWQPLTLTLLPPRRGAARVGHELKRLGYESSFPARRNPLYAKHWADDLDMILRRGAWMIPELVSALSWSGNPFLVRVLALPILAKGPPTTVKAWRRMVGTFSYHDFEDLFRGNGAPAPKRLLDQLRILGAAVWAAQQPRVPDRRRLAAHLKYSTGSYVGRRIRQVMGHTAGQLMASPVEHVVAAVRANLEHGRVVEKASR